MIHTTLSQWSQSAIGVRVLLLSVTGQTSCLLLVPYNPVQPAAWTGGRRLSWLPLTSCFVVRRVACHPCRTKKKHLLNGGWAPCEPSAIMQGGSDSQLGFSSGNSSPDSQFGFSSDSMQRASLRPSQLCCVVDQQSSSPRDAALAPSSVDIVGAVSQF